MLTRLSIRDIVLIDRLDLDVSSGLSVLTGETGAGKSILLDAFALALGGRGDVALVRTGAENGQVTAAFDPPERHPVRALMAQNDIAADDGVILRRVQFADGRTRAFVNDQPVSVQTLKALGAALVEIHGQHDERALVDAATHRTLLDAFGALDAQAAAVAQLWSEWREREVALAAHRAEVERAQREAEWLRHAVAELSQLAPQPSEETVLAERRAAMMQAEKIAGDLREAHEAVAGEHSPVPALAAALRAADHDPGELERIEERLFALRAATRKYNVPVDALAALATRYGADLGLIDAGERQLAALAESVREADQRYRAAASALSDARRGAAQTLDRAVNAELKPLKLERARFETAISTDPDQAGPHGIDRVEFWVETNPGTRPGPLMKIASGGELARFLLALKVVLADRGSAPTLIFDEIDTGVGGAVSDAIGVRLARLARRAQVMAVTHAPQVAARADQHLLISKDTLDRGKRVATRVNMLAADHRREEIARMLAGAEITAEARAAAERLIKAAG